MASYSKNDIIMVKYPFSDLSGSKVRPAVIVSVPHPSQDVFIVALTSKTGSLLASEFLLADWAAAGLNVPKRNMKKKNPILKYHFSDESKEPSWVSDSSPGRDIPYTREELDLLVKGVMEGIRDTPAWKELVHRVGEGEAEQVLRARLSNWVKRCGSLN